VFGWRSGLDLTPRRGRYFYIVFGGAVVAGMALNFAGTSPIRMLFLSALLNGLLAPPLLLLVMLVGSNPAIMGKRTNGPWLNVLGWLTTALMFFAAIAFFVTSR
jgi:Mn2+/Fe2+ NRAMP family transporter